MKLEFLERLELLKILPQENNYLTLIIIRNLQDKLGITAEEQELLEIKNLPNGRIQWNPITAKKCTKEISLNKGEIDIIKKELTKLDNAKKLTTNLVDVYEKFFALELKEKEE